MPATPQQSTPQQSTPQQSTPQHWDTAYAQGDTTRGWYQSAATVSLDLLRESGVGPGASILDIGAGASVFVDDLLAAGFSDVTVLDQSPIGLQIAQERLADRADDVTWIVDDLRQWTPPRQFDVWHDRAVAHFLLDQDDRDCYRSSLMSATHAGSLVIIGVFGPQGPTMCAGLPVRRHTIDDVNALLGPAFTITSTTTIDHVRPDGDTQQYLWSTAIRHTD